MIYNVHVRVRNVEISQKRRKFVDSQHFQFTEHGEPGPPGHHAAVVVALGLPIGQEHVIAHARLCLEMAVSVNLRNMACVRSSYVQVKQI